MYDHIPLGTSNCSGLISYVHIFSAAYTPLYRTPQSAYISLLYMCSAPLASTPVWAREFNSPEELITEFCRECRIVRKGTLCGFQSVFLHIYFRW